MSGENSVPSPAQRLAINPRRPRVPPEKRKRVVRACNRCNAKRIKCSGDRLCAACRVSSSDCQYASAEEWLKISRTEYDELKKKAELLDQAKSPQSVHNVANSFIPTPSNEEHQTPGALQVPVARYTESGTYVPSDGGTLVEERVSNEGRVLQDPDGIVRFLGESSGAAFLDQLREFMATLFPTVFNSSWPSLQNPEHSFISSLGQYQTHDSRPLLIDDVDPHKLPSRTEASIMLADLRYFVQDGSGDFESGGIYYWYDMDNMLQEYHGQHISSIVSESNANSATWNATFAVACQINPICSPRDEAQHGENFFARAKNLLGNPLDVVTLSDVRTLALLAFYLLGMNRRDAAYIYISVAVHILIVHGVHRGWMVDEQGKRTFWTVYILDRSLSCLMGRPPMIPDEAIKIDLPRESSDTPPAAGLRAHVELYKISTYVVGNIYDVAQQASVETYIALHVDRALAMLSDWLEHLPGVLRMPEDFLCDDRACIELHMTYNQLTILTIRPILLVAIKRAAANRLANQSVQIQNDLHLAYIHICIRAARANMGLCRSLLSLGRTTRLLQINLHHLFNAAIVLELSMIIFDILEDSDLTDVTFAKNLLESDRSGNSNYSTDCAKVLSDLGSLTARLRGNETQLVQVPTPGASTYS